MNLRKTLLVAPLVLSQLLSAQAYSKPQPIDPKELWNQSGLSFKDFENSVLKSCYESSKMLLACVDSMNVMAASLNPPAVVASAEEKILDSTIGEQIESLGGGLALYKRVPAKKPTEKTSLMKIVQDEKSKRNQHVTTVEHLFHQDQSQKAPFVDALERFKAQVLVNEHQSDESVYASYLFNVALGIIFDPHTRIQTRAELEQEMGAPDESFVGIGASIRPLETGILIEQVHNGGAMKAGMHTKDIITEVDGKSVAGMPLAEASKLLKGTENTTVTVKVLRGKEVKTFVINRMKVTFSNVEYSVVNHTGNSYGYIKLRSFMDDKADAKIRAAVIDLKSQGVKGFIIDLRGNGGGLLNQAVSIGSIFMGKQKILSVKDLDAKQNKDYFGNFEAVTDLPLVTLIDGGSASASEILSGAIQDHQRGWVVGDRSFGKGTVQAPFQFDARGKVVLFRTIQRFYQPSGRTNQIQGIHPDFNVDPFPGATAEDRFSIREEDEYTNALPAVGAAWTQPRPAQVKTVSDCRTASGKADALYAQNSVNAVNLPDYRLLVAQDILNCAAQ